jgi:predicted dithiol-disulfide oxidoreductase (DUF899 family)
MTTSTVPHPPIVSRKQWLDERKKLLVREKELTKHRDRINAERRRLPMVKIEKDYGFDGPKGKQGLPYSRVVDNLSSTTSCSTRRGTRAAQAAQVM